MSWVIRSTDDIEMAIEAWQKRNRDKKIIGRNEAGIWWNRVTVADMWYDRSTRSWIVAERDGEGNQIGEAYYTGMKSDALLHKKAIETQPQTTGLTPWSEIREYIGLPPFGVINLGPQK